MSTTWRKSKGGEGDAYGPSWIKSNNQHGSDQCERAAGEDDNAPVVCADFAQCIHSVRKRGTDGERANENAESGAAPVAKPSRRIFMPGG